MPDSDESTFDPGRHLTKISGRDYLEVKWRLVWLRREHPDASIITDLIREDEMSALFRCTITLPSGAVATGWGSETQADFGDWLEKAETKSIGRACAALGYGTQFCSDHDFGGAERGRVVDAPVDRTRGPRAADPATERQIKAIYAIGRAGHLSDADLVQRSQEVYGCPPEQLERRDASNFIDLLKQEMSRP